MSRSKRLLTEGATPELVAEADILLRGIRTQQRLVDAWEHGFACAKGYDTDEYMPAHPDNPYVEMLQQALDQWEAFRSKYGSR